MQTCHTYEVIKFVFEVEIHLTCDIDALVALK